MSENTNVMETALETIASAQLTPTEHLVLKDFVQSAVDPQRAGRHVLQRIGDYPGKSSEGALRDLKADWRRLTAELTRVAEIPPRLQTLVQCRDGPQCSLIKAAGHGKPGKAEHAYIIPPRILECPHMMPERPLFSLFEVFLTPSKVSRLRGMLLDKSDQGVLKNLWCLSPSIHSAFQGGHLKVQSRPKVEWDENHECDIEGATEASYSIVKLYPEECSGLFLGDKSPFNHFLHRFTLRTTDPNHLPLPSGFLFRIHYSFATALHLFSIEDKIARGWPRWAPNILGRRIQLALRTMWLLLPTFVRVSCYRCLSRVGPYLYGGEISILVQRLPFGLYLKKCNRAQENEPSALKMVERYTSAPAPLLIDTFRDEDNTIIIMTRVRGQMLQDVFHLMSYAERDQLADDLRSVVKQLRGIPNHTPYRFADTLGGPMVDHRVPDRVFGPFHTEADFNNHLYHIGVGPDLKKSIAMVHARQHRSVFTHSDLHPTNILVEGGRLAGIVDWECAAFKPEYWEFTKAMYGVWNDPQKEAVLRRAFENLYAAELEVEQAL